MSTFEQNEFGTVKCVACNRPNSPSAIRCLWCGILLNGETTGNHCLAQIELSYLGGIERLDNPESVQLIVLSDGIEIKELMPGSRVVKIAAEFIIEARVANNIDKVQVEEGIPWWRKLFFDDETNKRHIKTKEHILRESVLTIRYRSGNTILNAAFRRDESAATTSIKNVANAINSLAQRKTADAQ